MRKRIMCPNPEHSERTPSYVLYDTHGYCFGCGYNAALGEEYEQERKTTPVEKEDLDGACAYINSLPEKPVRGLSLRCDSNFYYVLFPGTNYYKRRAFNDVGSKYLCPRGHQKPLFIPYKTGKSETLAIVEGEINALSLSQANPPFDVCSPGGCSSFYGNDFDRYKQVYLTYKQFIVIVDRDGAGVKAAIEIKTKLFSISPNIKIILMDRDLNDILISDGIHGIRKTMEMWSRL